MDEEEILDEENLDPNDPGSDDNDDNEEGDLSNYEPLIPDYEYEDNLIPETDEDDLIPHNTSNESIDGFNYTIIDKTNPARGIHSLQIMLDTDSPFTVQVTDQTTVADLSGVNTWNHFRLIPSSRPIIAPPEFRSSFIEIPGADGLLDVSGTVTDGYPVYGRRKGDIEFYVTREYGTYYSWTKVYSNIMSYLHGRLVKCILMDDPAYYYRGRMTVNSWRSEKDWSKIVLNYDFEPYKHALFSTRDRWLWDPFDFVDGVVTDPINYFGDAQGTGFKLYITSALGDAYHDFIVTAGDMRFVPKLIINNTENVNSRITLNCSLYRRTKNGNGTITETPVTLDAPNLIFDINANSKKTINVYTVSVKNGSYRLRITYAGAVTDANEYDNPESIRIGLLYRYGSL